MRSDLPISLSAERAKKAAGRCWGSLFFSVFGGVWLLLGVYAALGRFPFRLAWADLAVTAALMAFAGAFIAKGRDCAQAAPHSEERRRADRAFGVVNAATWASVFLVFQLLPRLHLQQFVFPALALLVGVHFFVLPRLYRHRANLVTGAAITAWSLAGTLLFRDDARIAAVALGTGTVLWMSAAWALHAAWRLLQLLPDDASPPTLQATRVF